MIYRFNSQRQVGDEFTDVVSQDIVKSEPMLFSCALGYARELGGPLTRQFLEALPPGWDDVVVDSRTHMLMPGWYPCIPGWHHDDVPRTGPNGQPDYDAPAYHAEHVMGLVNGHICPTQFAVGDAAFPRISSGRTYEIWHESVEAHIDHDNLKRIDAPSNRLIFFDWQTWHRGTPAVKSGWRWFIRASRNTQRPRLNEVRTQVQIYLPAVNAGW